MTKVFVLILFLFCHCNFSKSDEKSALEKVQSFYDNYHSYNFNRFGCMNILQWNQTRNNINNEYHVEVFPNCDTSIKPQRGKLKYEKDVPLFLSSSISEIDKELFLEFENMNISNLYCKGINDIAITIYPNIQIIMACNNQDSQLTSLDSCWHYKIIKSSAE